MPSRSAPATRAASDADSPGFGWRGHAAFVAAVAGWRRNGEHAGTGSNKHRHANAASLYWRSDPRHYANAPDDYGLALGWATEF